MKSLKHITWDNIKTVICVVAITFAVVAYLRSDVEEMGLLKNQYMLEENQHLLEEKVKSLDRHVTIMAMEGKALRFSFRILENQGDILIREVGNLQEVVLWVKRATEEGDDTTW